MLLSLLLKSFVDVDVDVDVVAIAIDLIAVVHRCGGTMWGYSSYDLLLFRYHLLFYRTYVPINLCGFRVFSSSFPSLPLLSAMP